MMRSLLSYILLPAQITEFEAGVTPRLSGSGLLVSQTPVPGSVVDKGQELYLVFEPAS